MFFDTWLKLNRKQIAVQEREAPLRNELFSRILLLACAALTIQGALLWRVGIRPGMFALTTLAPGILLVIAIFARHRYFPVALSALFMGIVFTVGTPASEGFVYPQWGAAMVLTILIAGLLVGKTFVQTWTFLICLLLQGVLDRRGWTLSAAVGWWTLYATAGWLVTLYSSHLQRLFEVSRAAEEQQRNAIVAERTRFARDIHDTLAQGFTGIMMQLNAAEQRLHGDSLEARAHIEKARELAIASLEEARRSVSALRIDTPASGSLLGAIEQIGRRLTSDSGVRLETELEGQPYALPEQWEANLLRIAQEALTNAVRHSGASRIIVRLAYEAEVVLEVEDNGRGISAVKTSGFGINGMRERARHVGGELQVLSDPGRGTRIIVTVPNA